jgi:peptidyl-prolyl cis-trans isomerase A (cyclophilin A)
MRGTQQDIQVAASQPVPHRARARRHVAALAHLAALATRPVLAALASVAIVTSVACNRNHSSPAGDAAVDYVAPPDPTAILGASLHRRIAARLETTAGTIHCELDSDHAPRGVAMFVGLATGRGAWREPKTGRVSHAPLYADRKFFRTIPGLMVQTGCPLDDSTGHPGYRIPVEPQPDDAALLSAPGALVLARYTSPPNRKDPTPPPPGDVLGSQFAVLLTSMPHLAGGLTVLGRCEDLDVVGRIAQNAAPERPMLRRVSVELEPR